MHSQFAPSFARPPLPSCRMRRAARGASVLLLVALGGCAAPDAVTAPAPPAASEAAQLAIVTRITVTPPAVSLAAGTTFTCQLDRGTRSCWGSNGFAQIGDGTVTTRLTAVRITGRQWRAVAGGNEHGCALAAGDTLVPAGTAYCWGTNRLGQLGTGTGTSSSVPVRVLGTTTFRQIVTAGESVCALDGGGATWCWGQSIGGQSTTTYDRPTRVALAPTFAALTAARGKVCGLTATGQAFCWGSNDRGALAYPVMTATLAVPTAVGGTLRFTQLAMAETHSCGIDGSGQAWCWGSDDFGQVGSSTVNGVWVPKAVNLGYSYKQLALTGTASCGTRTDNVTVCWGSGPALGRSLKAGTSRTPTPTTGGLVFTALSGNRYHICGTVPTTLAQPQVRTYCWGENLFGALGTGDMTTRTAPTPVVYSSITIPLAP